MKSLWQALHSMQCADERWAQLRERGVDDKELRAAIIYEFGIGGASAAGEGSSSYAGLKFSWASDDRTEHLQLEGDKLAAVCRRLLGIPIRAGADVGLQGTLL